ncbi:MAG: hypothetical protein AAGB10_19350 [Pseudomonadota bacterium]
MVTERVSERIVCTGLLLTCCTGAAWPHATEQAFVLLLPTGVYTAAGVASVALTALLLVVIPAAGASYLFRPFVLPRVPAHSLHYGTSALSTVLLLAAVWAGFGGARDPSENPLPLLIWTIWWIGLVTVQGLLFDIWRWINPWTAVVALIRKGTARIRRPRLPFGHVIGMLTFLAFCAFLMVDPAPTDPARLAGYVAVYWITTLIGIVVFGPRWLYRAEAFSMMMRAYGRTRILGRTRGTSALGLPGWRILNRRTAPLGLGLFVLLLLGGGSFDGLNETYRWFTLLGINPLEFPGRSAVVLQNLIGLVAANMVLIATFALTLLIGLLLIREESGLGRAMRIFAPSILPIALGYHIAHYLTAFMVDGQYALVALSDPMHRGDDFLGLGPHFVSTGFFNTQNTVRAIWLTQAGAVVVGHILSLLLAHALAVSHYGSAQRAVVLQAPLAVFMVAYTLFGLWLLASPRGG